MYVVVINGYPRTGKTTFTDICCEIAYPYGKNLSTVDFIKEVATLAGWDGTKNEKNRKFLSDLKKLMTEWDEVPMKKLEDDMKDHMAELAFNDFDPGKAIFFVHCREPEEIQKLVDKFNAVTVIVSRDDVEENLSNDSDKNVELFPYNVMIKNNASIQHLELAAKAFMEGLHFEYKFPYYNSNMRKYKCTNNNCTRGFEVSCIGCSEYRKEN